MHPFPMAPLLKEVMQAIFEHTSTLPLRFLIRSLLTWLHLCCVPVSPLLALSSEQELVPVKQLQFLECKYTHQGCVSL